MARASRGTNIRPSRTATCGSPGATRRAPAPVLAGLVRVDQDEPAGVLGLGRADQPPHRGLRQARAGRVGPVRSPPGQQDEPAVGEPVVGQPALHDVEGVPDRRARIGGPSPVRAPPPAAGTASPVTARSVVHHWDVGRAAGTAGAGTQSTRSNASAEDVLPRLGPTGAAQRQ